MTGGLIQLISSGKQDSYLTYKPEITYFKKTYRRHTIFGTELIEIYPEQQPEYNNKVSFNLSNVSDLINKCYIEITIPTLSFQEDIRITNLKITQLNNIQKEINKWNILYQNLKSYCSIEILLYQILIKLLESINITITLLKQNVINFNSKYKKQKDNLNNSILDDVFNEIDLTGYISKLSLQLVDDDIIPNSLQITKSQLKTDITNIYNNMIKNLKYYQTNLTFQNNQYEQLNNKNINFAWSDYLAHNYFTNYEVEIGGQIFESYTTDQSYIYQAHHLKEEYKNNYYKMIGHNNNLNKFNNTIKTTQILILPLNFWFCKDIGISLPSVAMANSSININLKCNKLKNILYFQDYEEEYNNFLIITYPYDSTIHNNLNINTFVFNKDSHLVTYNCKNINNQLLTLKYPSLQTTDINYIITTYGDSSGNINLKEWINFKQNYGNNNNPLEQYKYIISPDDYNNYNSLLSLVPKPQIKLIINSIFLDDVERNIFASSKLEYVVEIFQENIFDIDIKQLLVNYELSIDRPIKELIWFTIPKIFLYGLSEYGKIYNSQYSFTNFFINKYYSKQQLLLNNFNILQSYLTDSFYNNVQSYQYYNNNLPDEVFAYNFGLFPEESQPSGTANFTMFKGKIINFQLNPSFVSECSMFDSNNYGLLLKFMARSYNFLIVEKGMATMIFATN
jgi:hypothetical protein